jgi:Flp pilus assembly protein TadG
MKRIARHSNVRHRGAVLVEMVLVTPILLFIMLATAEVTRIFVDQNTLTKAVRNGIRHVAANAFQGTTGLVVVSAALRTEAQNLVVYGNIAGTGTPVLAGLTPADVIVTNIGGNNIEVSAAYAISGMLGPTLPNFFGPDINLIHNLQATVAMRAL